MSRLGVPVSRCLIQSRAGLSSLVWAVAAMLLAMWRVLSVGLVLMGCVSSTTPAHPGGPYPVAEKERFRVLSGDKLLGYLIHQEIEVREQRLQYFRVERVGGGWAGNVDPGFRFFKCEPFRATPRELGVYSWEEGLGLLLETSDPLQVLPMMGSGEATEAAARTRLRQAMVDRDS